MTYRCVVLSGPLAWIASIVVFVVVVAFQIVTCLVLAALLTLGLLHELGAGLIDLFRSSKSIEPR